MIVAVALDDSSIDDSDELYRRIPPTQAPYNTNLMRLWPSSAALLPSGGDTEVSVYLGSVLSGLGIDPAEVLECHEGYGLVLFPAVSARVAGYYLNRDPVDGSDRPLRVDPAHAIMFGEPSTKNHMRRLARCLLNDARLVVLRDPIVA